MFSFSLNCVLCCPWSRILVVISIIISCALPMLLAISHCDLASPINRQIKQIHLKTLTPETVTTANNAKKRPTFMGYGKWHPLLFGTIQINLSIQTDTSFINRFSFIGVCHLKHQINLHSHRSQFVLEFIIQQTVERLPYPNSIRTFIFIRQRNISVGNISFYLFFSVENKILYFISKHSHQLL